MCGTGTAWCIIGCGCIGWCIGGGGAFGCSISSPPTACPAVVSLKRYSARLARYSLVPLEGSMAAAHKPRAEASEGEKWIKSERAFMANSARKGGTVQRCSLTSGDYKTTAKDIPRARSRFLRSRKRDKQIQMPAKSVGVCKTRNLALPRFLRQMAVRQKTRSTDRRRPVQISMLSEI